MMHFLPYNPIPTDTSPQAYRYSITNEHHWLLARPHKSYSQDLLRYATGLNHSHSLHITLLIIAIVWIAYCPVYSPPRNFERELMSILCFLLRIELPVTSKVCF